ncbi:myb-like protein X [Hylaeus anthracinus]|uniref:myb-like protein X n=1 Tax=Hylaeus anthracinus TaxID=313031 RepID=UPI0023B8BC79|nr:myb-like protein X [Hylaeus anthracinus]XP_054001272.1 myb-like protein X [Hylaeus anthracinus]XP_054001273.1 myb-like protein X [Hylaeus anthracinus]XP_054001274.1 myb-like protein X [Hylaeus anthracinus]XP_054001275.1 myb-like protein X [Hylaeus anthracinus]XP_054001276.1 myb-like protein X [Hylaeus anthracinus]
MPNQYCFLCASDEGVFLDITADNKKQYHEQFEICSLVTVPTADKLPTKICHKCAYELKQCSSFVRKYKHCTSMQKKHNRKYCCNLCFESTEKEYIFNLSKDKTSENNILSKLQKLFDNEPEKSEGERMLICLSCRYTVDVLFDLKNISQEIATNLNNILKGGIDYVNFPKIKTAIVSRKTTVTDSARTNFYTLQDSNTMARKRSRMNDSNDNNLNEKLKLQVCEKCHSSVSDNDANIQKLKNTEQIVCKSCSVDTNLETNKIDKQSSFAETKSCTVFLKDVLRDKTENQRKLYEVKEDRKGKKTYVVTDNTLENSKKEVEASSKVINDVEIITGKQGVKRSLRHMKTDTTDNKESLSKKLKPSTKQVNLDSKLTSSIEEPIARKLRLRVPKAGMKEANRSSESDSSINNSVKGRKNTLTRHKRATGSSLSDADIDSKRDRKKLKSILAGNTVIQNLSITSSADDDAPKRKRLRFTSASPVMIDLTNKNVTQEVSRRRTAMRNLKLSSTKGTPKNSKGYDSVIEISSDDNSETYACEECGSNYENKLVYMSHKLTHYKQPKLELEKMVIKNIVKDTSDVKEAVDDECIQIRVDDDEDDEIVDVVNNLDASPVTNDRPRSSTEERIENTVDVESITKDPDDQQNEDEVKKAEDQRAVETSTTNSPSKVRTSSRRGRFLNQQNQHEQTNERRNNVSLSPSGSQKEDNASAEENHDTSLEQTKDAELKKHQESPLTQTENGEIDQNQDKSDSPTENASAKENEDGSLTQLENTETEKNKDISLETTNGPQAEDVQDKENEESNESRVGEKITDAEEGKEKQKKSEDIDGEEEIVCTRQDIETSDKENESNDKENETNDKESEISDKENETNDKESETSDKENETNGKKSKTIDKENETINEENETNGKENSIELDSTKVVEDIADEEEVDSSKTIEHTRTGDELTDGDLGIIDESISENAASKMAPNSAEKIEISDENKDDEVQCTQEDVVSISSEKSTSNNDGKIVEKDLTETSTASPRKSKNDSTDAAVEVLQEVLDLANAEVQKRQEFVDVTIEQNSSEMETLENISREISNGGGALKENSVTVSL